MIALTCNSRPVTAPPFFASTGAGAPPRGITFPRVSPGI